MHTFLELYRYSGYFSLDCVSPIQTPKAVDELTVTELIDEFGDLEAQYRQIKPLLDRRSSLRERINGLANLQPAGQPVFLLGERWRLLMSARRFEYQWKNKLALWRKLGGLKLALNFWNPSYEAVCEVLGAAVAKTFRQGDQTGWRTIEAVRMSEPQQAPASASSKAA